MPIESVEFLRKSFKNGIATSLEYRKIQLRSLFKMMEEKEDQICEALEKDLHKSHGESKLCEILTTKLEISDLIKKMDTCLANEKVPKTFITLMDSTWIQRQPYGLALCMVAWNYPIYLAIAPLAGLIAAGNCVILKPSEIAVNCEKLLMDLIPNYVDENVCRVERGDIKRTGEILKERFDYIMYTGSTDVGKIVMEAASKHLTPVTLECGGKSPTYVDKNVDLKMAVRRIVWSKYLNAGQTCVAPDYLLCHKDVKDEFIKLALETIVEFYSTDASSAVDYARIISKKHYSRLMDLLKGTKGKLVVGGEGKEDIRCISPTIVTLDSPEDALMKGEIFGPILPIITVESENQAIEIINNREKPLALYVFSNNRLVLNKFHDETTSGGLVYNDCIMQLAVKGFPFGGVGLSGIGRYHGKFSIEEFSHKRSVLDKDTKEIVNNLFRYPPYNEKKEKWMEWGLKSDTNDASSCSIL